MKRRPDPEASGQLNIFERLLAPVLGEDAVRQEKIRQAREKEHTLGHNTLAVRAAQRARMVTQDAVARAIGVSRPQLANALQGRFGLSRSAAANLRQWLEAA